MKSTAYILSVFLCLLFEIQPLFCNPDSRSDTKKQTSTYKSGKLVISVFGDSLADGLWGAFFRRLGHDHHYEIVRASKNSSGFVSSPIDEIVERALNSAKKLDALVVMVGVNDRRAIIIKDNKLSVDFGTPRWIEIYSKRIKFFLDRAQERHIPLIWLLLPSMRDSEVNQEASLINRIIEDLARDRANVTLFSTWPFSVDESGSFRASFKDRRGRTRLMRQSDGIHFTFPAYEFLANEVLVKLQQISPEFKALAATGISKHDVRLQILKKAKSVVQHHIVLLTLLFLLLLLAKSPAIRRNVFMALKFSRRHQQENSRINAS